MFLTKREDKVDLELWLQRLEDKNFSTERVLATIENFYNQPEEIIKYLCIEYNLNFNFFMNKYLDHSFSISQRIIKKFDGGINNPEFKMICRKEALIYTLYNIADTPFKIKRNI